MFEIKCRVTFIPTSPSITLERASYFKRQVQASFNLVEKDNSRRVAQHFRQVYIFFLTKIYSDSFIRTTVARTREKGNRKFRRITGASRPIRQHVVLEFYSMHLAPCVVYRIASGFSSTYMSRQERMFRPRLLSAVWQSFMCRSAHGLLS